MINLFNLIPIIPLDGADRLGDLPLAMASVLGVMVPYLAGRFSTYGWIGGFGVIFVGLIVFTSLPRVIGLFRPRTPEQERIF